MRRNRPLQGGGREIRRQRLDLPDGQGSVAMPQRPTLLERAFELARSGEHVELLALIKRLKSEGYMGVDAALSGPSLRKQLRDLCRHAESARHKVE